MADAVHTTHVDVVSAAPESLWTVEPWEPRRDGEWLTGRGAGDMKAGLAAIVGAMAGLRRLGLSPCAPVELQSVVEEECTGNGAAACVIAGSRADAAILTEPTALQIWNAQVGVLWFSLRVAGRPAHAAYATTGENAIEATYPIIAALRALEAELNADPPPPFDAVEHPVNLNVRLPLSQHARLERLAERWGMKMSPLARLVLDEGLDICEHAAEQGYEPMTEPDKFAPFLPPEALEKARAKSKELFE